MVQPLDASLYGKIIDALKERNSELNMYQSTTNREEIVSLLSHM